MLEILRDQIWQFVGAAFGFAAIIISIILWWTQRRRKALSYEIISRTSLLSIEDEIKGKLEIFFDGKPVQDVHLIVFKIINSGNVPIVSTDYERPVNLSFGESAQILTAEILETDPDNLEASVDIEATRAVLEPVLLNGGDSITLKFLVSHLGEISVDGRIVGIRDIREPTGFSERVSCVIGIWVSVLIFGGLVMTVVGLWAGFEKAPLFWGLGMLIAGTIIAYLAKFIEDVKAGKVTVRL